MRPTSDPKTEVIKIRVNEETARELKKKGNVSAVVRELVIDSLKNPKIGNSVPQLPADMISDFESILTLYDTDFESFFRALYKKVESMEIDVDEVMK